MITELTDREILDFLMISDFNDNLSPEESRFLLLKFRNFYRVCSSKNDLLTTDLDRTKKDLESMPLLNNKIQELESNNQNLSDKFNKILNKKLSIKERLFGKIIES